MRLVRAFRRPDLELYKCISVQKLSFRDIIESAHAYSTIPETKLSYCTALIVHLSALPPGCGAARVPRPPGPLGLVCPRGSRRSLRCGRYHALVN
jgi:hypothetical protein